MHLSDPDYAILNAERIPVDFPSDHMFSNAMDAWTGWCKGNSAPMWSNVDLIDLPSELVPNTVVVDVIEGGKDFRYRFWGTGYSSHYGIDETRNLLSESIGVNFIKTTFEQLGEVVESRNPCAFHVSIKTPRSGIVQTKLNLRLPVIDENGVVDKIITVSEFGRLTLQDAERLKESIDADRKRLDHDSD